MGRGQYFRVPRHNRASYKNCSSGVKPSAAVGAPITRNNVLFSFLFRGGRGTALKGIPSIKMGVVSLIDVFCIFLLFGLTFDLIVPYLSHSAYVIYVCIFLILVSFINMSTKNHIYGVLLKIYNINYIQTIKMK